ncbi:hypothetical protein QBC41DRAFT_216796, partial [Cercophora samala]
DVAICLAKALKRDGRPPDIKPLIDILPTLTHDQMMELRHEYKRFVKTRGELKGVNIAKHIRSRLKDEDHDLMQVCYATALGRWESEAYWVTRWYHGDKGRNELIIESLMGRPNDEIRLIKDGFKDEKYDNSLTKCLHAELREGVLREAVMAVLKEERMEEIDEQGLPLYLEREDVKHLNHALKSGTNLQRVLISTVTQSSDRHLSEMLEIYNQNYDGANLAKDALKASGNELGEIVAHVFNGVINKPLRDAMLIHHALTASRRDPLRNDLLISRLVRCHWNRGHMRDAEGEYRSKYGMELHLAVRDATSGEFGRFCEALVTQIPKDDSLGYLTDDDDADANIDSPEEHEEEIENGGNLPQPRTTVEGRQR